MHDYMKKLKKTIKELCIEKGCTVDEMKVRGSTLFVYLMSEQEADKMYKNHHTAVMDMIDADGAGYTWDFDAMNDMRVPRKNYTNTQGIEARVSFQTHDYL